VRRAAIALGLLLGTAGTALSAQRYWVSSYSPYVYYRSTDGWWLAGFFRLSSPLAFEPRPEPWRASAAITGGMSTEGSYYLQADAQAPAWWDGWRLGLTLSAVRFNRLGYYGIGNDTRFAEDSAGAGRSYFYKVSRETLDARLTVERRLVGPLRMLGGALVQHSDFRGLPGETVFERDLASGTVDPATVPFTDVALRGGVVLDIRDHEIDPHRGVVLEAMYADGRGYTRTTGSARAYVQPVERLIVAARVAAEQMTGNPPLAAQQLMETTGVPYVAVGGYRSLRGHYDGRFTGAGKLLGGLEARYALLWAPTILELKLVAFYDAGRVFAPGENPRLTTDDLHHAGGGELALRIGYNSLVVFGAGFSDEGFQILFGTSWSY
jgi:outer membrane protein assembly factor BamA